MRLTTLLSGMMLFLITSTISATSVNGRFIVVHKDESKLSLLLQINNNTGVDAMGGATIVIGFDTTSLSFKNLPVKNVDYTFHNFCGGVYSTATVTRPMIDKIWVNIYLPITNVNLGSLVAKTDEWMDVVTINFDIKNTEGKTSFFWLTNSSFWGIYDDDNITLWETGSFVNKTDISLSVELGSFSATLFEDKKVLLKWSTISSVNHLGFEIEKKSVGKNQETEWEKIGYIASAGNSNTLIEYSFIDETPHKSALVQYRLKNLNADGTFTYSNIIEVQISPVNFSLEQNYPNPFNPSTKIVVKLPQSEKMKLVVYNLLGEEIIELANSEFEAGIHEFNFNAAGLASGIYIYRIESNAFSDTKKMVLLR